jgi:hypothetical protein
MAHSTIDSPLAQTTYGISGEHRFRFSKAEFRKFQRSIDVLRHALYQDMPINTAEFLIIENYMLLLEKAYLRWRRHHGCPKSHH